MENAEPDTDAHILMEEIVIAEEPEIEHNIDFEDHLQNQSVVLEDETGQSGTTNESTAQVLPRTQCLPMIDEQFKREQIEEEEEEEDDEEEEEEDCEIQTRKRKLTRPCSPVESSSKRVHSDEAVFECKEKLSDDICVKITDPWFDVKKCILHASYTTKGPDLKMFTKLCNIFLKGWRVSKQLTGQNQRLKQKFFSLLSSTVDSLYERGLINVRGPESDLNITKMITTELKLDKNKLIMSTPPLLSILVTEELFNKYFDNAAKYESEPKKLVKSVHLGPATEQWYKLQKDLQLESPAELATVLLHCYKAWTSIACGKCRRHMEIGMGRQAGKVITNGLCIVSCECGKSTSGGFMIECDQCHKWQHGVCVDVNQKHIPDTYTCPKCKNKMFPQYDSADRVMEEVESDTSVVSVDNEEVYTTDESGPEVIELD